MDDPSLKILVVDDEEKFLSSIAQRLTLLGAKAQRASNGHQAIQIAQTTSLDLAIVDLQMPDMDGLVTIAKLKEIQPDLRSVLLTGHGNEKIKQATEALDAGYFEKDAMGGFWNFIKSCHKEGNVVIIRPTAAKNLNMSAPQNADQFLRSSKIELIPPDRQMDSTFPPSDESVRRRLPLEAEEPLRIIGETPAMQNLRRHIKRFSALDCSMIIYGETGVGKELAARSIHALSARKQQRFMAINCGSFSNDLLIEELLGFDKNTATEIHQSSNSTPGGTILLDQIEDMSPKMQLAMLKVLDHRKESIHNDSDGIIDIRILAASSQNLEKLSKTGQFREELFYRLNVIELKIPPLRDRRDDIAPLSSFFLNRFNKEFGKSITRISDEVTALLESYDFPGNVRELEHLIERAVILTETNTLETRHLPERFRMSDGQKSSPVEKKFATLAEIEKLHILEVLKSSGGNKSKTADILGISRAALWRKLKQYDHDAH